MNINRIIDNVRPPPEAEVKVKLCGNIVEVQYMKMPATGGVIQKVSADLYVNKRTGEVKEFTHKENRAEDKASVAHSLKRLRDIINTNLTSPDTALWVTLTYAENMTDTKRLYEDFRRFWQKFCYYLKKCGLPPAEYIAAAEPQGRGAWHLHCLFLFPGKAPYISNDDIAHIWGHGFTKTKNLKGINNPGLYLTAYLGDMEVGEAVNAGVTKGLIQEKETAADEQGQRKKKAIIKGARLKMYPPGFNLYRCSRGVKRPEIIHTIEAEAQKMIGDAPLTYEKTIKISSDAGETKNIINYRQFEKKK